MIVEIYNDEIDSLDILLDIAHVKYLIIIEFQNKEIKIDYTPLYKLKNLKLFHTSTSQIIEVDRIEGLEALSINPESIIVNKDVIQM